MGEARTVDTLILDTQAYLRRCELMMLQRLTKTALVTYSVSKCLLRSFVNELTSPISDNYSLQATFAIKPR